MPPSLKRQKSYTPASFLCLRESDPTRPNLTDFRTKAQWQLDFSTVGSPGYIADDKERQEALGSLFPVGTINPTTGVPSMLPGLDFDVAPPKDEGEQVWKIMGGNFGEVT